MALIIYLLPYIIWQQKSYVYSHDNLDGLVPMFKFMANNGFLFSKNSTVVPMYMNGLPRVCYGTEFNIQYLFYFIFPPYIAYVFNVFMVHFIAIIGCILLLKTYWLHKANNFNIQLIALCFGLLPFWYAGGISIAGQPIVIYALLNLAKNKFIKKSYLILFLYIIYSMFFWAGIYFLAAVIIWAFFKQFNERKYNQTLTNGTLLFLVFYFLSEYRLLYENFFGNTVFHRIDYNRISAHTHQEDISNFFYRLKYGYYQVLALHYGPLLLLLPLSIILILKKINKPFYLVFIYSFLIFLITLLSSFLFDGILQHILLSMPILNQFSFSRFNTFMSIVTLLFIVKYFELIPNNWLRKVFSLILIMQIGFCFFASANFRKTITQRLIKIPVLLHYNNAHEAVADDSFDTFFKTELYDTLKNRSYFKNYKNFNTSTLGIHAAQLLYNDINCINGYINLYPLQYKQKMQKICSYYFEHKFKDVERFRNWGNRCYLFDVKENGVKPKQKDEYEVFFETSELKSLNCKFLLSAYKITNSNFVFKETLESGSRQIYIYEII